jgi:hypothetical protein
VTPPSQADGPCRRPRRRAHASRRHARSARDGCETFRVEHDRSQRYRLLYVSHVLRLLKKMFVKIFRPVHRWKAERETVPSV